MANELDFKGPIIVGSLASDPSTGYNGEIYYNTTLNAFRVYQFGTWTSINTSGSGAVISDWSNSLTFTPSSGFGVPSNVDVRFQRIGDSMRVRGVFTAGNPLAATSAYISLPGGYAIDTTKLPSQTDEQAIGTAYNLTPTAEASTGSVDYAVFYDGSTTNAVFISGVTNSSQFEKSNCSDIFDPLCGVSFEFYIPISGWTSAGSAISALSIGVFDANGSSPNGLSLSVGGNILYAQSASTSNPGMVNTATQSMAGAKTFTTSVATPILLVSNYASFTQTSQPSTPATANVDLFVDLANTFSRVRTIDGTGFVSTLNRDNYFVAYNQTGTSIPKGSLVYINGSFNGASSYVPTVALAQANSPSTAPAVAFAAEAIANNGYGRIQFTGLVSSINTSAFTYGQTVYLSATAAGAMTATAPSAPNISQVVGIVTNASANGSVAILLESAMNAASGTYLSSFQIGPGSGSSAVSLAFANANVGTISWNPTATRNITLPDASGTLGTVPSTAGPVYTDGVSLLSTGYLPLSQIATPGTPASATVDIYNVLANTFSDLKSIDGAGLTGTILRDGRFTAYNQTGSTIPKGSVVYINGNFSGTTSFVPTVALAQANAFSTSQVIGVTAEAMVNNGYGRVQFSGLISGINTSSFAAGAQLYLSTSTPGGLTATQPTSPNISEVVAYVTNSNASGSILLCLRAALNTASGTYLSNFQIGPGSGSSPVALLFANAQTGTLAWNPSTGYTITLPPSQGAAGTVPQNDGAGNLSWATQASSNVDGGTPSSVYTSGQVINGGTP